MRNIDDGDKLPKLQTGLNKGVGPTNDNHKVIYTPTLVIRGPLGSRETLTESLTLSKSVPYVLSQNPAK